MRSHKGCHGHVLVALPNQRPSHTYTHSMPILPRILRGSPPGHCHCGYDVRSITAPHCPKCGRRLRDRHPAERPVAITVLAATGVVLLLTFASMWIMLGAIRGNIAGWHQFAGLAGGAFRYSRIQNVPDPWRPMFGRLGAPAVQWAFVYDQRRSETNVRIPLWIIAVPMIAASGVVLFRARRRLPAHCRCGFDLTGTTGPCPECGRSTN